MAVSGKTAAPWEIPYLEESDIPDMGAGDKAIAERLHAILNGSNQQALSWLKSSSIAGQIIVCNKSGVPQYVTPSGDVSLSESGDLELGKGVVGTEEVADKAITLGKLANALGLTEGYFADGAVTSRKAKLTAGFKKASSATVLGEKATDIPGASLEITPSVESVLFVVAQFKFIFEANEGNAIGEIYLDGESAENASYTEETGKANETANALALGFLTLSPAKHTVKLTARRVLEPAVKAGTYATRFNYILFAK